MKKFIIFIVIAVIVLAGGTTYYFTKNQTAHPTQQVPVQQEIYENNKYGFSFNYPKKFSVSEFTEGGADVVLVKDTADSTSSPQAVSGLFQISISPFDEPGPITKERILKDIPDMRISNDKEVSVGGEKALSFTSQDASLETLEIWFVRNGNLYQISALSSFGDNLEEVIKTWKFR